MPTDSHCVELAQERRYSEGVSAAGVPHRGAVLHGSDNGIR